MRRLIIAALAILLPFASFAQPRDRNDWEAYYQAGIDRLGASDPSAAQELFDKASHLSPDRAEPLYGLWIAFWARNMDDFTRAIRDDQDVAHDPKVIHADSLRMRAVRRNPFVHQGPLMFLYDRLPGRWRDDPVTRAWIALGQANLPLAITLFGQEVNRDPARYGYLRFVRASAFVNSGQPDSAAAELATLLAQLRASDNRTLGNGYQSKELLEYASGLLQLQARHAAAARAAFQRSVVENAGFAPAHAMLGEMAAARHDTATAFLEFGSASELDPEDVEIQIGYGKALRGGDHAKEAIVHFRKAVALEPQYATPYFWLAATLDEAGDRTGAIDAFAQYIAHASLTDAHRAEAEMRVKQLQGGQQ